MKSYFVEFIGTFLFLFIIAMAVQNAGPMAPLAIGAGLMVLVFAGGHISGAHYNPAVTIAVLIRGGQITPKDAGIYIAAQLLGAITACLLVMILPGHALIVAPGANVTVVQTLIVETVATFALAYVVLNVATHPKTSGNSHYGLAIGFTVVAMAFAVGSISGGAFNPAVGVGSNLALCITGDTSNLHNIWLYIVGPVTGGILAGFFYRFINS